MRPGGEVHGHRALEIGVGHQRAAGAVVEHDGHRRTEEVVVLGHLGGGYHGAVPVLLPRPFAGSQRAIGARVACQLRSALTD